MYEMNSLCLSFTNTHSGCVYMYEMYHLQFVHIYVMRV